MRLKQGTMLSNARQTENYTVLFDPLLFAINTSFTRGFRAIVSPKISVISAEQFQQPFKTFFYLRAKQDAKEKESNQISTEIYLCRQLTHFLAAFRTNMLNSYVCSYFLSIMDSSHYGTFRLNIVDC